MANSCVHPNMPKVPFDEEEARTMGAFDIRQKWPRLTQVCPDCKEQVVCYGSLEHYVSGDW